MAATAEERACAVESGEDIFSLAVPFAACAPEHRIGANHLRGKKTHQGIFSKKRAVRTSAMWSKWSGTHQVSRREGPKTALGIAIDANGNTLTDAQGRSFTWDFENRLTQVINPGVGTTTFRYDPFGRRIQKSGPLGTTNFLYDADNVIEEVDQSGNALARYSQHGEMDQPLSAIRSGTVSYYQQDGLGSVSSLSNSSGTLANTYTYDSFGNVASSTGTLVNPLRYTAREFDLETGIYEYRMRYYDPSIGRFISEDPIGFKGGVDFYAYVNNRPINLADPTGLKPCGPDCTKADPLPSNSPKCDNYGSETYLGASEKCFCKCAGDSAWAQKVRGCLACAFENGQSKTGRHKMCYDAAGWGDAPYRTLINCERKCLFSH